MAQAALIGPALKILVVSQYFWPENFRVNDLVAELVARGHEVTVLTGQPNYPDGVIFEEFKQNPEQYAEYMGAKIVRVPIVARGRRSFTLVLNYLSFALSASLKGAFSLRGRKFDRIFVFEPSPVTVGIPAIFLKWLKAAPIIFWVLDLWPESLRAVGVVKSEAVLDLVGQLVKFIYKRCDVILVQSRSFIADVLRYCPDPRRICFFPSWAEDVFDGASDAGAMELEPYSTSFKIVFAGNIGESQDFPAIIDAATICRHRTDIKWILIGDGRMAEWVENEINARGLEGTVFMPGRFPLARMPSFYASADVLLVTLKQSAVFAMTIPGKIQSYLAAGRPIIGMLDGEGASVIAAANAGMVCDAGDAQALALLAQKMANLSIPERSRMGHDGRAYYLEHFDRAKLMNELELILLNAGQTIKAA